MLFLIIKKINLSSFFITNHRKCSQGPWPMQCDARQLNGLPKSTIHIQGLGQDNKQRTKGFHMHTLHVRQRERVMLLALLHCVQLCSGFWGRNDWDLGLETEWWKYNYPVWFGRIHINNRPTNRTSCLCNHVLFHGVLNTRTLRLHGKYPNYYSQRNADRLSRLMWVRNVLYVLL